MLIKLALKSLHDRRGSVVLSIMAMTVSIFVLLGVEHIRHQTKTSFSNTVSGVDLIVGARTSSLNLLLYSVFKIGNPTNNISWRSFENIAANPKVKWAIPLSLGDSHKGYRVLGTTSHYFKHFRYGKKHPLTFKQGEGFNRLFDVVLGAEVAKKLNYALGDKLVLAHGVAKTSFSLHKDNPFMVVGVLAPTGTPVDHTLHVSLQAIEEIHQKQLKNSAVLASRQPENITAIMLGLKSKITTFRLQREINHYVQEPLSAILPGVALSELWQMMKVLESTLILVSALVFMSASIGVCAMLLSSIRERNKEMHLLRTIGASPLFLFRLITLEALFIVTMSISLGIGILVASLFFTQDFLVSSFGLHVSINILSLNNFYLIAAMMTMSLIIAMIPFIVNFIQSQRKKR
jgi:putative ABC transport system permease protein